LVRGTLLPSKWYGRRGWLMTTARPLIACLVAPANDEPYSLPSQRGNGNHQAQRACSRATSTFFLLLGFRLELKNWGQRTGWPWNWIRFIAMAVGRLVYGVPGLGPKGAACGSLLA